MISVFQVYLAATGVYVVALAVLLAKLRRVPDDSRLFCQMATFLVALGAVTTALTAVGAGTINVAGNQLALPGFVNNLVTYPALWAIAGLLAAAPRRMLALVAGLPFVQVVAFQVASYTGGAIALAASAVVIVGHLVLLALFRGRIWTASSHLPDERRLLHWKSRNLLLFLIGMLIVFAFLSLAGLFSAFGSTVLNVYIGVLIRVGFAGFLFANVDALRGDPQQHAPSGRASAGAGAGAGGSPSVSD